MSQHRIQRGQEYESCQPTVWLAGPIHTRIRVTETPEPDWHTAEVVTVRPDGTVFNRRRLAVSGLHPSGLTRAGAPRRTGYRLVRLADGSPADGAQQ